MIHDVIHPDIVPNRIRIVPDPIAFTGLHLNRNRNRSRRIVPIFECQKVAVAVDAPSKKWVCVLLAYPDTVSALPVQKSVPKHLAAAFRSPETITAHTPKDQLPRLP